MAEDIATRQSVSTEVTNNLSFDPVRGRSRSTDGTTVRYTLRRHYSLQSRIRKGNDEWPSESRGQHSCLTDGDRRMSQNGSHVRRLLPQIPNSKSAHCRDNTDGQYSGDSGLLEYSTASLDRKNKRKGSLESLRVGNATAQGIKTEEVQNHQRNHVPMGRSASLEQLNELEKTYSPMTPPPTLRFKAYQARKRYQRRKTDPEGRPLIFSVEKERKKTDSIPNKQQDIFDAVMNNDVNSVAAIVRECGIDINQINEDGHTPLDIAIMVNSQEIGELLFEHGAKENSKFYHMENFRGHRLEVFLAEAERRVTELTGVFVYSTPRTQSQSGSALVQEYETQLRRWEMKKQQLQQMKQQYDACGIPDPPSTCELRVASSTSLLVSFDAPRNDHGAFVTRYKVEWSRSVSFSNCKSVVLVSTRSLKHYLTGLQTGAAYVVRVSAYNMKGYGPPCLSSPRSLAPSSWRDVEYVMPRVEGQIESLTEVFEGMCQLRESEDVRQVQSSFRSPQISSKKVQKTLSRIFRSAVKFTKNIKRGVYLALLFYSSEGGILSTVDDQLPVIEVDESYPSSLGADFQWLLKVGSTWEDIQAMQRESSKVLSSSSAQLRHKLMTAIDGMQSAVGIKDLGQLHYEPIRDTQNSIVIVTAQCVREFRPTPSVSLRWTKMGKLNKKQLSNYEDNFCGMKQLVAAVPDIITFNQNRNTQLSRGLYLGYVQLEASVEVLRVVVPLDTPNVLPHVKLRDNPNVSKEEWLSFKIANREVDEKPQIGLEFMQLVYHKAMQLLTIRGVPDEDIDNHQLYTREIIELSHDVAFLLLLPPSDKICAVPGQLCSMQGDTIFTSLPLPTFELLQWQTYQTASVCLFSRASAMLDIEQLLAQHCLREAFSEDEIEAARTRQKHVSAYAKTIEDVWRGMHWIAEVVQFGRDHNVTTPCSLAILKKQAAKQSFNGQQGQKTKRKLPSLDGLASGDLGELRVYPAYDPTLDPHTSVKLHVGCDTTAVDIVRAVVERMSQDKDSVSSCDYRQFCLVAVIGSSERWLRGDFCPLQLQNPWTKGRLFVMKESQQYSDHRHSTFV